MLSTYKYFDSEVDSLSSGSSGGMVLVCACEVYMVYVFFWLMVKVVYGVR